MSSNVSVSELYDLKHLWNGEGDLKSRELFQQNVRILIEWIYLSWFLFLLLSL